ncbi:MAG: hypothetical protein HC802_07950 [Caldilineaceae bacterium]|nr:hypothetical protein [Caldilineaceae bacterium]
MNVVAKYVALVVVGILMIALLVVGFGSWWFGQRVTREVKAFYGDANFAEDVLVTEAMLQGAPAPIQRYLRHAGVVGKPMVHSVRLEQEGRFRTGMGQPWMPIRAEEFYSVDPPGFIWDAKFYMAGLPILRVRDSYRDGKGEILGKIGGLVTMLQDEGEGLDQGAMLRYLQEMIWFPSAFLGDNISFTPIDDGSAQVTFTDHGKSVTGTLFIDPEGNVTNFVAERFRSDKNALGTWTTPMSEVGEFEGLQLPIAGKGVWLQPEGDYEYVDLTVTQLEYDATR